MKFLIVFVALFAIALAEDVHVVRSEQAVGTDSFEYAFETSDGVSANQEGHIQNAGHEDEAIKVTGSYTFVGDDGVKYTVNYVADENGFQPQGAHLPVAPVA